MKIATVEVVFPSMCKKVDRRRGISSFIRASEKPARIDRISGFFENFLKTRLNPCQIVPVSSLYSSSVVMDMATPTGPMEDTDNTARCSACFVGKAKVINGRPKKATLPKTVLTINK